MRISLIHPFMEPRQHFVAQSHEKTHCVRFSHIAKNNEKMENQDDAKLLCHQLQNFLCWKLVENGVQDAWACTKSINQPNWTVSKKIRNSCNSNVLHQSSCGRFEIRQTSWTLDFLTLVWGYLHNFFKEQALRYVNQNLFKTAINNNKTANLLLHEDWCQLFFYRNLDHCKRGHEEHSIR